MSFSRLLSVLVLVAALTTLFQTFSPVATYAADTPDPDEELVFFYTDSCPYCQREGKFLDDLQDEYPELAIARFNMADRATVSVLSEVVQQFPQARQYQGAVPLTFYQDRFFIGFDEQTADAIRTLVATSEAQGTGVSTEDAEGTGAATEDTEGTGAATRDAEGTGEQENYTPATPTAGSAAATISVPFWGEVAAESLSAPILAAVLGIVDGFNVCSVGALILILSIVLKFRNRRLIIFYGTIFIGVTAAMYLLLILAWYKLFQYVAPHLPFFEVVIGLLAIAGGTYFLREFIRFQRFGVTCESSSNEAVTSMTNRLQTAVATGTQWRIALAIAAFAAVVTLIEFPCSAAIPLTLSATLATMELSVLGYLGSMSIFVFFYLLDELLIFLIAVWSMRIWINSSGFVKYAALVGSLVLFTFGFYYIFW